MSSKIAYTSLIMAVAVLCVLGVAPGGTPPIAPLAQAMAVFANPGGGAGLRIQPGPLADGIFSRLTGAALFNVLGLLRTLEEQQP